ncbi:hypothetical protein C6Y45_15590 [Alkalicoccus saliphilus]|uniref:Uncharacterized protein n=1 Tax=Alkalicoccus saliphilus TaxID=200989 RepID=A0A2T4U2H3_9BACI|nr:hypothetical protein C6Y45_15590 [Alkalicoccus saliphilus]
MSRFTVSEGELLLYRQFITSPSVFIGKSPFNLREFYKTEDKEVSKSTGQFVIVILTVEHIFSDGELLDTNLFRAAIATGVNSDK